MFVKQLSIFIENKPGRLTEILETIKDINISALSLADTLEFGVLRLIVTDTKKAEEELKKSGVIVKITDVVAFAIADVPGGLAKVMEILRDNQVSVEYMYAFSAKNEKGAMDVLKASNPEKAVKILKDAGVELISQKEVENL